jgi:hypothetical protein
LQALGQESVDSEPRRRTCSLAVQSPTGS